MNRSLQGGKGRSATAQAKAQESMSRTCVQETQKAGDVAGT